MVFNFFKKFRSKKTGTQESKEKHDVPVEEKPEPEEIIDAPIEETRESKDEIDAPAEEKSESKDKNDAPATQIPELKDKYIEPVEEQPESKEEIDVPGEKTPTDLSLTDQHFENKNSVLKDTFEAQEQRQEAIPDPSTKKAAAIISKDLPLQAGEPVYDDTKTQEPQTPDEPLKKSNAGPETDNKTGLFSKLKSGLSKTRQVLTTDINELFGSGKTIDEDLFDELEELLVTSDLGIDITMDLMDKIRKKSQKLTNANELKQVLKAEIKALFPDTDTLEEKARQTPHVIMVVGVNGTGKTTTLGKLASKFTRGGNKVLIAAADTFRAAAIEQVEIWAKRSGAAIVRHKEGADPAAVAYDAVEAALARNVDIVLIDTAGRLHTQKNLMEELKKIKRSVNKKYPGAPHEVLMVLDATTGQNAISQANLFNEAVGLTQIALTKLDGTAKGGIVAAISNTMNLPIKYIGVGEQIDDLQDFDAALFIEALFDA